MKSCEAYEQELSAMLDGALPPRETQELKAHLAVCAQCAAQYDALSRISAALGTPCTPPPDLHGQIMEKLRTAAPPAQNAARSHKTVPAHSAAPHTSADAATAETEKTKSRVIRLRPILTAAACFVLVLGGAFWAMNGRFAPLNTAATSAEAPQSYYAAAPEAAADSALTQNSADGGASKGETLAPALPESAPESAAESMNIAPSAPDASESAPESISGAPTTAENASDSITAGTPNTPGSAPETPLQPAAPGDALAPGDEAVSADGLIFPELAGATLTDAADASRELDADQARQWLQEALRSGCAPSILTITTQKETRVRLRMEGTPGNISLTDEDGARSVIVSDETQLWSFVLSLLQG